MSGRAAIQKTSQDATDDFVNEYFEGKLPELEQQLKDWIAGL